MAFKVEDTSYGVTITDVDCLEVIAVEHEDIPQLIKDLQARLPIDFNEVAYGSEE